MKLKAIVPHSFGDHSQCDARGCGYLNDPTSYKHSFLPYGKDLIREDLKRDLIDMFCHYSENSKKMANESMKKLIAAKAPKYEHLGGSSSLSHRLAAAVSPKKTAAENNWMFIL